VLYSSCRVAADHRSQVRGASPSGSAVPLTPSTRRFIMRRCFRCHVEQPLSNFHKAKASKDGMSRLCKNCKKIYDATRHKKHLVNNPVVCARKRAHRAKNLIKMRAKSADYQKAHRPQHAERQSRRRASKRMAPIVEKINPEIIFTRDKWICQLCHKRVHRRNASLDHVIPLSLKGEHSYRNIVLVHKRCNSQKGNRAIPQQQRLLP